MSGRVTASQDDKAYEATYHHQSPFQGAIKLGSQGALVGTFVSVVQNALGTHSEGALGFATRYGGNIGFIAAMGATLAATEAFVANQREKDDAVNGLAGGCAAGFLLGLRKRSLPIAAASCAFMGAAVGTYEYAGNKLAGGPELSYEERRKRFFKQHPSSPPLAPTDG
ncbi:unnamed protein product [Peniophora sp. CBMAI 1063]|nr:unnamed protein product [Peniophora sp. CBMAI 1063]